MNRKAGRLIAAVLAGSLIGDPVIVHAVAVHHDVAAKRLHSPAVFETQTLNPFQLNFILSLLEGRRLSTLWRLGLPLVTVSATWAKVTGVIRDTAGAIHVIPQSGQTLLQTPNAVAVHAEPLSVAQHAIQSIPVGHHDSLIHIAKDLLGRYGLDPSKPDNLETMQRWLIKATNEAARQGSEHVRMITDPDRWVYAGKYVVTPDGFGFMDGKVIDFTTGGVKSIADVLTPTDPSLNAVQQAYQRATSQMDLVNYTDVLRDWWATYDVAVLATIGVAILAVLAFRIWRNRHRPQQHVGPAEPSIPNTTNGVSRPIHWRTLSLDQVLNYVHQDEKDRDDSRSLRQAS